MTTSLRRQGAVLYRSAATESICKAATSSPASSSSFASSSSSSSSSRSFTTSATAQAKPRRQRQLNDPLSLKKMEAFNYDDVPTLGHYFLARKRELLNYARIVQWELPKLAGFRKQYQPPAPENILRFRSHHYQGEAHPSSRKSVVTVQVSDLFNSGRLDSSPAAKKKLLLLAGVRWDALGAEFEYPTSESLEKAVLERGLGRIKISCERYPEERMNLKWCSDTIDKLIEEANTEPEKMQDVPLDVRHLTVKEAKRGGFDRRKAASIRDFPSEWLPSA
ncbi:hypothetical protein CBS101457_000876 [Exobasidium rhododendri]|nr:hypothetical protein CBS101457_000876 [Exobasidium rhododendri]